MVENSLISGVATEVDIVSGEAPGSCADTEMVGKSTVGRAATGRKRYANRPAKVSASDRRIVATGRRMKGSETFMLFTVTRLAPCGSCPHPRTETFSRQRRRRP